MPSNETAFTALRIEGGLLPPEFLARVAALDAGGQMPADYGVPPGRTLRDEIGRYWSIAEALWKEYREQRQRADVAQIKVGVERWLSRLLREVLGYSDLSQAIERAQVGERGFPISHWTHGGRLPFVLTTFEYDLDRPHDRFGEENRRRSPHAALQEYVNADPKVFWGGVSNGSKLRILRDNPSLTRPAFIEVDLERVFEEGLYADFAAFWLLAHASRSMPNAEGVTGQRWEIWRTEGTKVGQRALDNLRAGVTRALRELGSGFVEHPKNDALRTALRDGSLTPDGLHQQLLRLIYRSLFLFAAEDRDLLHPGEADQAVRELYAAGYSLARLRERARFRRNFDEHSDLWSGLSVTFMGLARGARPLGLPALGGLFNPEQCVDLGRASITNARLLGAVNALAFFTTGGVLQRVNYRDMGAEELGSVYESLLELHPAVQIAVRPWTFGFLGDDNGNPKGNERKLSGSYYTPDSLVQELLRSTLDPVIERTIRENPHDPRGALLGLKIVDPACGSGHFLLGAARHMADALARLETASDLPEETLRRRALRDVARRCIYGVDRNPLSVELCKAALWIETIEPNKPLSFLDGHIKCGDSLVGVFDLTVLRDGIPDQAFKELSGDDKPYVRDLRKRNKSERETPILSLLPEASLPAGLADSVRRLNAMPDDTVEAVEAKRKALAEIETGETGQHLRTACDLWCAAFYLSKAQRPDYRGRDLVPTTDAIWRYLRNPSSSYKPMIEAAHEIAARGRFFHWPLAFPDVFSAGGFDVVLGNPPWEVLQFSEDEFFHKINPEITRLKGVKKKAQVAKLLREDDRTAKKYATEIINVERHSNYARECGRFQLVCSGKLNLYALFAKLCFNLTAISGRLGLVVPTGIATEYNNREIFAWAMSEKRIASLVSFENEEKLFPDVHNQTKFCLLTCAGSAIQESTRFVFFARNIEQAQDQRRWFKLSGSDIKTLNPTTATCPVFRNEADSLLTKKIYGRANQFIRPWKMDFSQGLYNMSSDSRYFIDADELIGAQLEDYDPLYEGKMIWHFDHRFGTYENQTQAQANKGFLPLVSEAKHQDILFFPRPAYFVSKPDVRAALASKHWSRDWLIGWRDVTNNVSIRTAVCTAIPAFAAGHSLSLLFLRDDVELAACLLGNFASIVLDYACRQKVSGSHLTFSHVEQLPFLRPDAYSRQIRSEINVRVIELTYTSRHLIGFARDMGFDCAPFPWSDHRRSVVQAELDAIYAVLYGLTRDELRYILDPTDVYGPNFPSETFRVLKEKEYRQFGEYRTARLVLDAWDRFTADGAFGLQSAA